MNVMKKWLVFLAIVFVIVVGAYLLSVDDVGDFESCVEKTGIVMESYPRQCIYEGRTYIEEITFRSDGISLARVLESGDYACFGCNNVLCKDPVVEAIEWVQETPSRYCGYDFEVIGR